MPAYDRAAGALYHSRRRLARAVRRRLSPGQPDRPDQLADPGGGPDRAFGWRLAADARAERGGLAAGAAFRPGDLHTAQRGLAAARGQSTPGPADRRLAASAGAGSRARARRL